MQTNTRSENVTLQLAHPDFLRWVSDWQKLNDAVDGGATEIKRKGQIYLPATSGQVSAWNLAMPCQITEKLGLNDYVTSSLLDVPNCSGQGQYAYYLYKFRANWYEYPAETVQQMIGRLTSQPHEIELPAGLTELKEVATSEGNGLSRLIEEIYGEQAKYSRCAILADFPENGTNKPPYMCVYGALRVVNWDSSIDADGKSVLNWVILDESGYVKDGINWNYHNIYRVCALDEDGVYFTKKVDLYGLDKDQIAAVQWLEPDEGAIYPKYKGQVSNRIPLVFINATNTSETPELPILNSVTNMSLAIYRGEADYRQALFVQGQATPAFTGANADDAKKFLLGANGGVASQNKDFRAYYMEVSGNGLSEMRESQTNLHDLAVAEGMKLINAGLGESGEALQERTASQTVGLELIASACEDGLNKLLGIIAEWGGITGEIKIALNREFTTGSADPDGLSKIMASYNDGAPITLKDIHEWAREGGLVESTWEEAEVDLKERANEDEEEKGGTTDE